MKAVELSGDFSITRIDGAGAGFLIQTDAIGPVYWVDEIQGTNADLLRIAHPGKRFGAYGSVRIEGTNARLLMEPIPIHGSLVKVAAREKMPRNITECDHRWKVLPGGAVVAFRCSRCGATGEYA
jgi:hypothetical protein